ncbi:hypothetical protein GCM10017788_76770 [Amycolatopsis acidiphila]|uniref:hypothetical protein n=1 Tax=Amycolatopsis acidiphila TaxID=715473 RepID=UPI00174E2D23|nr:hypothetical protein [Amycolatopsis acidiphila]GHG97336.1 hypothetical protein GCM10017788_76770 [Amycolatopsis acidiphila]
MIQIYRPPNHTDDDHRYALVVDGGDGGIELYDQGGELRDLDELPDGWVEQVPVDKLLRPERDRFYGFTDHGHPVGPKPEDVEWPDLVARCGALAGCPACRADAGRLREVAARG